MSRGTSRGNPCRYCLSKRHTIAHTVLSQSKSKLSLYLTTARFATPAAPSTEPWKLSPPLRWYNVQNVSYDVDGFFQELNTLLEDLRDQAAGNGSLRKFAAGTATAPNFQTIYGLAQCTPDLTEQDCRDCLGSSLADIPECCQGKVRC
ncbi:unnamed protein product [Prunus armeniaca]|uniref:Gnk2-homologous domain-containing protein n=1 Tax=Prunus armeniaca TaxID=36596 RepID=A0A6J5XSL5_PRUAR|nr:unnamed protein product [Prunus armeniaca]